MMFFIKNIHQLQSQLQNYFLINPAEIFMFIISNCRIPSKIYIIILQMIKLYYLVLACILAFSATQKCGDSAVSNIQTGLILLGVPTSNFSQTTFVQTLKGNLGSNNLVMHAFAIAGFQGSCSPKYYALTVDTVVFENLNTKMRFTMDYEYDDGTNKYTSQWTKVKLTYLLVTDAFESYSATQGGQYLWAGSALVSVTGDSKTGLFSRGSVFEPQYDASTGCGYLNKLPTATNPTNPKFDIVCPGGSTDAIIPHYYIMGFQFASGTYTVGAWARITEYLNQNGAGAGQNRAIFGTDDSTRYGPIVEIMSLSGVKKLKVGFVLTTLRNFASYPNQLQAFGYSGIYMPVQMENVDRPITQGVIGQYNVQRFDLAKATYQIYGLSSFTIAPSSKCVAIDVDVQVKDLYTVIVKTDNVDQLNDVFVSGDFYSKNTLNLCGSSASTPARTMTEFTNKYYTTVPDFAIGFQNIQQTLTSKLNQWSLYAYPQSTGSTTITYSVDLNLQNFIANNAYKIKISLVDSGANTFSQALALTASPSIRFTTQVNGKIFNDVLLTDNPKATGNVAALDDYEKQFGIAINTVTPNIKFTVTIPRPIDDDPLNNPNYELIMVIGLQIDEYTTIYNPVTDCCDSQCPVGSGINLKQSLPTCVVCKGDKNLAFDTNTGICSCATGYYNVLAETTGNYVCFPCLGKLCATCSNTNITYCSTCVVGAALNATTKVCSCLSGYYESAGSCLACPNKCTTCQVDGVCNACSDPNRKLEQNCQCAPGLYDDGTSKCKTCNPICKTCSSATTCTSCFTENNRALVNGQCVCASGYYQIVNANNEVQCRKCSSECKECTGPLTCLDCNAANNRIIGYDQTGHQTCLCAPGFTALKDGNCVENGCNTDPYCQNCDNAKGIKVCIQCIASTNRVLAIPQYACLCKQGYYESNGVCKQCAPGCAKCSSANTCDRCAVSATNANNGTCNCPASYFFTTEPIRFCKRCNDYCLQCTASNNCNLCLPGFSATTDGQCICPRGNYINSQLQCVPCIGNCTVCSSEKVCTLCSSGFYLQAGVCVKRCNVGFYISGVVCQKCQQGCQFCQKAGSCAVCQPGRYAFNGLCYINCPEGSIADNTNNTCIACNSPCKTCVQHPSKCLTCSVGNFFQFACPSTCPTGTYNDNGICKYCSFECAACLGNPSTCIACPEGQFLFGGSCYAKCPIPLVNGRCPNVCPSGYFTASGSNNCVKCNDKCKTCQGSADKCTSCVSGVATNGNCVTSCPSNTVNINGNCVACAQGCNGCTGAADVCSSCQSGYFLSGNKCLASCAANQYRDGNNGCKSCDSSCKTCSAANFCTSCTESRSQPINGVCYPCLYPCATCTAYESCTACLTGFNLLNGRCTTACPAGSTAVNGVCRCSNGVLQNGVCVSSCLSGFTNINGNCVQCSSDCAECSGTTTSCTACKQGYALNAVSGKCQVNKNCQFGQYFSSENNICTRICPTGYSYQDSVCVAGCLSGFKDNGFGGCVTLGTVSGCSFPYFFQQGVCVSNCNAGSFPNSDNRICQACSSNCFSCFSSAFCMACNSGFDLKNGICVAGSRCTGNKIKYNGVCVDSCPVGTLSTNGYCERRCDPNTYFLNGKCYPSCPVQYKLRTDVACVTQCDSGFVLDGKICKLSTQSCASGEFFNAQTGSCSKCSYPCSECLYAATYCTACPSGFSLASNKCNEANSCGAGRYRASSGSCTSCPTKCSDCVSATQCSTCASGYVFNGYDCILKVGNLKQVTMTQSAVSRRNNTVFVSVKLPLIPNGLSADQKNNFFIVIPSSNDKVVKVNQFLSTSDSSTVIVAVEYASYPTSLSTLFLTINTQLLSTSYINVGYTPVDSSFLSVIISSSIAQAPNNLVVPATATNSLGDPVTSIKNPVIRTNALKQTNYIS